MEIKDRNDPVDQIIEILQRRSENLGQASPHALIDHSQHHTSSREAFCVNFLRFCIRSRLIGILVACAVLLQPDPLPADTIPVRHTEGLMHGFLMLRNLEGKTIAEALQTDYSRRALITTESAAGCWRR